jgi:hypothetical protein
MCLILWSRVFLEKVKNKPFLVGQLIPYNSSNPKSPKHVLSPYPEQDEKSFMRFPFYLYFNIILTFKNRSLVMSPPFKSSHQSHERIYLFPHACHKSHTSQNNLSFQIKEKYISQCSSL